MMLHPCLWISTSPAPARLRSRPVILLVRLGLRSQDNGFQSDWAEKRGHEAPLGFGARTYLLDRPSSGYLSYNAKSRRREVDCIMPSEVEERIHKALQSHPLEKIELGYRDSHPTVLQRSTMKTGTIVFDGIEYPDGNSSDPNALGLMQGSPPPLAKRIRFEDDRYLDFPQIRWSLSHMRELVPTAAVWRGNSGASEFGVTSRDGEARIDALAFDDLQGQRRTWAGALAHTYTDGIIVLHRGARVYERYFGALQPQRPELLTSAPVAQ
jgi:hypothetical protein